MSIRTDLERRIDRERLKISDLRDQLGRAEAFVQGLQEALRMLPRETATNGRAQGVSGILRAGGDVSKTQDLLRTTKRPMHITEILEGLGKEVTKTNRASLTSSLARYARRGEIFDKAGPNRFGLLEFARQPSPEADDPLDLPDSFGSSDPHPDDL